MVPKQLDTGHRDAYTSPNAPPRLPEGLRTLHHARVRGVEGREIFREDADRVDFLDWLAALAEADALT